jgi:hypothetical protein
LYKNRAGLAFFALIRGGFTLACGFHIPKVCKAKSAGKKKFGLDGLHGMAIALYRTG